MVLESSRRYFDFWILPLAHALRRVNPNAITLVGLLAVLPAAWLLWTSSPATELADYKLIIAVPFVFLHGILDLLDGVVARTYHQATALGDYLDHVADRIADILLLSAVAFSPWGDVKVGLFAIAVTLLVSYLGTQAQAVGAGRMYSGFVARADRIVLLLFVPFVDHVFVSANFTPDLPLPESDHALGLFLWYIAIGGTFTAFERFLRIYLFLRRREAGHQRQG